jgi:6-pyruvoyltetrahydropterin/6-carboxytetrahydropterin synthase
VIARLGKRYTFEAAHQLPNHNGKCARLHGHSYSVELVLEGEVRPADGSPSEGMVMDFGHVSAAWRGLHERLDHRNLNDELPPAFLPSTAEHLAGFILVELHPLIPELIAVRVWETATGWAEVRT